MESRPLVDDELPGDGMDDVMANVPLPRRRITEVKFRGKDMYPTLQNLRRKKVSFSLMSMEAFPSPPQHGLESIAVVKEFLIGISTTKIGSLS